MDALTPKVGCTAAVDLVNTALLVPSGSFSDEVIEKAKLCLLDF